MELKYKQIGVIRSPFSEPKETPIQSSAATEITGKVELFPEFADGLKDIEGFSHIILIYHFHLSKKTSLEVTPYMDTETHGVFSTRAPGRPNPVGISIVRLTSIEGNILLVKDIDIVNGTPLIDIKPYVPEFDIRENVRTGWLETNVNKLPDTKDDGRFAK